MWIDFSWDIYVAVSCRGISNSLIFTKTWSMKGWILVLSSSLYFRKSVFSFRVDSILKWRVYIKLKVSWLCAFLWCMSQTSHDPVNSRRVRTHKKNSGDGVRRLGTIIQSPFLCPIRNHLEMVRWESVPRGSSARAWKLSLRLVSQPDWLPLGLWGWLLISLLAFDKVNGFGVLCNSDVNLVNGEANFYFLMLVLFRPHLVSTWLKHNRKTWINRYIDNQAIIKVNFR